MKKQEIIKRATALVLAGTMAAIMNGCSKKNDNSSKIVEKDGISFYVKPSNETIKKDSQIVDDAFRFKFIPSKAPEVYEYNTMLDSPKEDVLFASIGHGVQSDKLNPFDGAYPVLPTRFNSYDEQLVVPSSFIGYSGEDILSCTDKTEDLTVLKGNDDNYYLYSVVTYTFNKNINNIKPLEENTDYTPDKPLEGDQIILTTLDKVLSYELGEIMTEPVIRIQSGVGENSQNVLDNNISTFGRLKPIEPNYVPGIENSVGLEDPEKINEIGSPRILTK